MSERRFGYVEELRAAGLSAPDDTTMHFLWQIVDEGVLGASKHVALSMALVSHILDVCDRAEALARATIAANFIGRTRGHDTPIIGNSLALLLSGLDVVPADEQSDLLRMRIATWNADAAERMKKLVTKSAAHLSNARCIMAFDYSSTVSSIVIALARQNIELAVVVPESRTVRGGARYLEEFLPAGLSVRYLPDAAIEYGLNLCDAALLGVETLRADGSFLNTIGSRLIARLAIEQGVEVYGCVDLLKLDSRSYDGHRPDPAVRNYDRLLTNDFPAEWTGRVDTRAPELEVVPSVLITALLTEHGPVPPHAIWSLGRQMFRPTGGAAER